MSERARRALSALAVLAAVGFVALGAVAGGLYWTRVELRAEQLTREQLAALATEQIPTVFTYDYQTVERNLTEAYNLLTPEYRAEFKERATRDIIPQAREREVVSQAHVVGAGVLDAHRTRGSVMVYMNRTVTDKSKESVYDGSRLRVDYEKVDGKWLIDYITPI